MLLVISAILLKPSVLVVIPGSLVTPLPYLRVMPVQLVLSRRFVAPRAVHRARQGDINQRLVMKHVCSAIHLPMPTSPVLLDVLRALL